MSLTLTAARTILDAALAKSTELGLKPLAVAVLDARGCLVCFAAQDGTSLLRGEVAHGKAYGALALGVGPRAIFKRAQEQPFFVDAVNTLARGALIPVPGGALIRDANGTLIGAIGVSGDSSENDEICVLAGIEAAGLRADVGS
ncbi:MULTISPECIES: heme-binding protein [Rhodomicrobium]|uniref:GlcG/HbpS family heme-binding protein n=1 Tax=Rhodomicrobium TaxID=1068 RepID=UPI000B4BA420|nr:MULTISPECIES: heme-binding protein [Rhodomicrobium]